MPHEPHRTVEVAGKLFGMNIEQGCGPGPCIVLYVEDDELYHRKLVFDALWLSDLISVAQRMQAHLNQGG